MTSGLQERNSGPGRALIVGVGGYPALPNMGLASPERSTLALTDWLTKSFRNPAAPLASIELLASAPGDAPIGYAPPTFMGLPSMIAIERPEFDAVRKATIGWRDRLATDDDDLGLFFFTGHGGVLNSDTMLLFEDFSEDPGATSRACRASSAGCRTCGRGNSISSTSVASRSPGIFRGARSCRRSDGALAAAGAHHSPCCPPGGMAFAWPTGRASSPGPC